VETADDADARQQDAGPSPRRAGALPLASTEAQTDPRPKTRTVGLVTAALRRKTVEVQASPAGALASIGDNELARRRAAAVAALPGIAASLASDPPPRALRAVLRSLAEAEAESEAWAVVRARDPAEWLLGPGGGRRRSADGVGGADDDAGAAAAGAVPERDLDRADLAAEARSAEALAGGRAALADARGEPSVEALLVPPVSLLPRLRGLAVAAVAWSRSGAAVVAALAPPPGAGPRGIDLARGALVAWHLPLCPPGDPELDWGGGDTGAPGEAFVPSCCLELEAAPTCLAAHPRRGLRVACGDAAGGVLVADMSGVGGRDTEKAVGVGAAAGGNGEEGGEVRLAVPAGRVVARAGLGASRGASHGEGATAVAWRHCVDESLRGGPDGAFRVLSAGGDGLVLSWSPLDMGRPAGAAELVADPPTASSTKVARWTGGEPVGVTAAALCPDDDRPVGASGSAEGAAVAWWAPDDVAAASTGDVALGSGGGVGRIACGTEGGLVGCWDLSDATLDRGSLQREKGAARDAALPLPAEPPRVRPSGTTAGGVAGSAGSGHLGAILSAQWGVDRTARGLLLSAGTDGDVRVWSGLGGRAGTARSVAVTPPGGAGPCPAAAWSPARSAVVAAICRQGAALSSLSSGEGAPLPAGVPGGPPTDAVARGDAAFRSSAAVALFDLSRGARAPALLLCPRPAARAIPGDARCLSFAADGARIAVGHADGSARVWRLPGGLREGGRRDDDVVAALLRGEQPWPRAA